MNVSDDCRQNAGTCWMHSHGCEDTTRLSCALVTPFTMLIVSCEHAASHAARTVGPGAGDALDGRLHSLLARHGQGVHHRRELRLVRPLAPAPA